VVLTVCALIVTGLVVRREIYPPTPAHAEVVDWKRYAANGHVMGPAVAAVVVIVFSDFQCPACKMLADDLRIVRENDPQRVRIIYRHYPLPTHTSAMAAAYASECAAVQGRFEAFHDALFAEQSLIGHVSWEHFGSVAALKDPAAFARCMTSEIASAAVARDTVDGNRLGLNATPMLLINGVELRGAPTLSALKRLIEQAAK